MAQRKTYHVTFNTKSGKWTVLLAGNKGDLSSHATKVAAVAAGKKLAKQAAPHGQIRIHTKDGKIQTEHTYGNDPRRYKG